MDVPRGHDQFIESPIVLRWLQDVKATRSHDKAPASRANSLGHSGSANSIECDDATAQPWVLGAPPCYMPVAVALGRRLMQLTGVKVVGFHLRNGNFWHVRVKGID